MKQFVTLYTVYGLISFEAERIQVEDDSISFSTPVRSTSDFVAIFSLAAEHSFISVTAEDESLSIVTKLADLKAIKNNL